MFCVAVTEHPEVSLTVSETVPGSDDQTTFTSDWLFNPEIFPVPPVMLQLAVWPSCNTTELLVNLSVSETVQAVVLIQIASSEVGKQVTVNSRAKFFSYCRLVPN